MKDLLTDVQRLSLINLKPHDKLILALVLMSN